jgi:hypothetical protein
VKRPSRLRGAAVGKTGRLTDQSKNASFRQTIRQVQFLQRSGRAKTILVLRWSFGLRARRTSRAPHRPGDPGSLCIAVIVDPLSNSTPFARKVIEEF